MVDISNPTSPQVVGTVNAVGLNGGYRVRVSGDLAYVSGSGVDSITAVDITNPAAPVVLTSLTSKADLYKTTGLDLMNLAGSEYVVASSPFLSTESSTANPAYPPYPNSGAGSPTATGTISAIQLDPVADTAIVAIHSEPSTGGQPFTTSTSANFIFATADVVSAVACSLDGAPFGPCTSETTADYSNLDLGNHTFSMRATDGAGNESVASYAWTIEDAAVNTALPVVTGSPASNGSGGSTGSSGSTTGGKRTATRSWLARVLASSGSPTIGRLLKKNGAIGLLNAPSTPGRIAITWHATVRHHRIVVARGSAALRAGASARVAIKLTSAGRALLTKSRVVKIAISGSFHSGATDVTAMRTLTLRR